jgi:hypothetical protein
MFAKYYKKEIADYCAENGLSASKVFQSALCYSDTQVSILHHTPKKYNGVIDDTKPMPVTLEIHLANGKLRFEQTEHTYKYLAEENHETAQAAYG